MTLVERAAIGKQGRVVIPAEIRRALDLQPGMILTFSVRDGVVVVSTPMAAARKLQEIFATVPRKPGVLASEQLIAERRAEAQRELGS
jgi:AbrB family looped-hinge helix DNA binding protein